MSRKPIIGVTPSPATVERGHGTFDQYAISTGYTEGVEAAGGVPIVLPPQQGNADTLLDLLDGLLLSGGGDIDPARYGDAVVHSKTYGIHHGRDELEIALVRGAIERAMPVLCICRGIQTLNVALGGTLIQDVADQFSTEIEHRQQENGISKEEPSHSVEVAAGSLLERVYGARTIHVNSFHHQGLRELAPDLRAGGSAPDGLIEAIEMPGRSWVLGVQWHPEMMFRVHAEHLRPFQGLVDASLAAHLSVA